LSDYLSANPEPLLCVEELRIGFLFVGLFRNDGVRSVSYSSWVCRFLGFLVRLNQVGFLAKARCGFVRMCWISLSLYIDYDVVGVSLFSVRVMRNELVLFEVLGFCLGFALLGRIWW
jgi:hypothetical protein